MNQHKPFSIVAALLLLGSSSAYAANHTVRVGGGTSFNPASLTIQRGDTVTFTNIGGTHNVVADNGAFRCAAACDPVGGGYPDALVWSSVIGRRGTGTNGYGPPGGSNGNPSSAAWSATITYNTEGTFGYHCQVHGSVGSGMAGTIVVQGAAPAFTIGSAVSGNWYDPAQNGHGIQFEMLTPTVMTAFWFTFDNAGNEVWVVGAGAIEGDRVVMQANRSGGGRFPPNFNPAAVVNKPWGTLTFTFTSCTSGRVDWVATDPAFTVTGSMPLTRLTQVLGTSCQ